MKKNNNKDYVKMVDAKANQIMKKGISREKQIKNETDAQMYGITHNPGEEKEVIIEAYNRPLPPKKLK